MAECTWIALPLLGAFGVADERHHAFEMLEKVARHHRYLVNDEGFRLPHAVFLRPVSYTDHVLGGSVLV